MVCAGEGPGLRSSSGSFVGRGGSLKARRWWAVMGRWVVGKTLLFELRRAQFKKLVVINGRVRVDLNYYFCSVEFRSFRVSFNQPRKFPAASWKHVTSVF